MGIAEHLTVAIPAEIADAMRSSIAAGDYENMDDVVQSALLSWLLAGDGPFGPVHHAAIRREVHAAMQEYDRDPSTGFTIDEVRQRLAARRVDRQRKAA